MVRRKAKTEGEKSIPKTADEVTRATMRKDGRAKTREVKAAAIFRASTTSDNEPHRDIGTTSYVATTHRTEKFGKIVRAEFDRRFPGSGDDALHHRRKQVAADRLEEPLPVRDPDPRRLPRDRASEADDARAWDQGRLEGMEVPPPLLVGMHKGGEGTERAELHLEEHEGKARQGRHARVQVLPRQSRPDEVRRIPEERVVHRLRRNRERLQDRHRPALQAVRHDLVAEGSEGAAAAAHPPQVEPP